MKQLHITFLLAVLMSMVGAKALAYDAKVNGIYYNFSGKKAEVTYYSTNSNSNQNAYTGSVVIPETVTYSGTTYSVTSIGNYAFYDCSGLTSITIPKSVSSIGNSAFSGCSGLTNVDVPVIDLSSFCNNKINEQINTCIGKPVRLLDEEGNEIKKLVIPYDVTSIGDYAFSNCTGLTSVTIPNSVTSIDFKAFYGCSSLTSVTIPSSVKDIGWCAFGDCSKLKEVYFNATNCTNMGFWCGSVFEGCNSFSVLIGDNVQVIPDYAFYGSGLTSVTIGNSVTSIGNYAFDGCSGLTSVEIPNSVTIIGAEAFDGCSGLTSVEIPNSVTIIGYGAFMECSGLTSVEIPNSVTTIGRDAFKGTALYNNSENGVFYVDGWICGYRGDKPTGNLVLSEDTRGIAAMAFSDCSGLTSITIPNPVASIGDAAFSGCSNLATVTIINKTPVPIESSTFSNRINATLYVPYGSKAAYEAAAYWKEFKEIMEMPAPSNNISFADANVKAICVANWDTNGDGELSEAEAAAVTSLGNVFKDKSNIASFNELQYFTGLTSLGDNSFSGCSSLTSITFPNTIKSIGIYCFSGCSGLGSISIPPSVNYYGSWAFSGCTGLSSVYISDLTKWCKSFFNTENSNPLYYAHHLFLNGNEIKELTIPTGITDFSSWVFAGCSGLSVVTIPTTVYEISRGMFSGCSGLSSVSIPSSVLTIKSEAFKGCSSLKTMVLPSGITSIDSGTFSGCSALSSLTILGSVTSIESCAFEDCISLTSFDVPTGLSCIRKETFKGCSGLLEVSIPSNISYIERDAFTGCINLEAVNIEDLSAWCNINFYIYESNPLYYAHHLYLNGVEIKDLIIPSGWTKIPWITFYNCSGLTSIVIPQSVTSIGNYAFSGCSGITTVTVEWESPTTTFARDFTNRTNATLYVPAGCKAAYETTEYWKDFKEIIEIKKTGDPTANTLSLGNITGYKGKQVVLPVALTNQHDITGFQFDLYLPAGVTVATKSNSKMMIETTERMEGSYSISSNQIGDYVRIVGYSGDGDAFTGNSGDILKVTLNIGENVADGDYTIRIKDIVLSDVNSTEYHPADAGATLTVKSYTLGDVDNSGAVNINDVVCIINHILNKPVTTFIAEAADVDGSGTININDVVTLINRFILNKDNAPAMAEVIASPRQEVSVADNYLHLANIEINPGETKEVEMLMTNANTVAAIQGNIKLPAGLSFVTKGNGKVDAKNIDARSEDFTLSCAIQGDGSLTFAQYSGDGFTYEGSSGGIFTFKIKAAEDATAGTYSVALSEVVLSINGVGYDIPDRTSSLTVLGASGISSIDNGELTIDNYYTLDGRMLQGKPTQKGVYIVGGRKVVIK